MMNKYSFLALVATSAIVSAENLTDVGTSNVEAAPSALTQELANKLASNTCFSGEFTQQLIDTDGTVLQNTTGTVQAQQPNNLRWAINAPDNQLIITNGDTLWRYEEDLEQLIVSSFEAQGAGLPARLLSGDVEALTAYDITENDGGYLLEPREAAGPFGNLELSFNTLGLAGIAMKDGFDQVTEISFTPSELPCDLGDLYSFNAPEGIDVIYE